MDFFIFPIENQNDVRERDFGGVRRSDRFSPQHYGTQSMMSWRLKRWRRIRKSSLWGVASRLGVNPGLVWVWVGWSGGRERGVVFDLCL